MPNSTFNIKHSTLKIKDYESKYLENNFADCNLLPYSHRYHPRYNKLQQPLKGKKVKK